MWPEEHRNGKEALLEKTLDITPEILITDIRIAGHGRGLQLVGSSLQQGEDDKEYLNREAVILEFWVMPRSAPIKLGRQGLYSEACGSVRTAGSALFKLKRGTEG